MNLFLLGIIIFVVIYLFLNWFARASSRKIATNIKKIALRNSNKNINVLYGGSVNTENIDEILKITNVDGVLVGGASLKAKDFLAIYSAAVKHLDTSS